MSTPRDLVLWLLEQGYETKYFKLSLADQTEWHETAVLEAERLKSMVDINLYQEYLSRLDGLGVKIKLDALENKRSQPQQTSINSFQIDLNLVLKRAIELRNKGEHEESLEVLNTAIKSGFESDLIDDNRARALVKLRRIPEALSIREKLANSDIERVKHNSRQFVEKTLRGFRDKLTEICDNNSYKVACLRDQCNGFKELEVLICKEVAEINKACHPEISMLLMQRARQLGFQLSGLNDKQVSDLLLKRAIELRNKGEFEESLRILNLAIKAGFKSDLIDDNCARTLVKLFRIPEALAIWEKLVDSDVQRVKESSRQFVEKLLQEFKDKLSDVCDQNAWKVIFLNNQCNDFQELEAFLLKEVIELRNAGHAEISLLLIKRAQQLGFQSPLLTDNKARALVSLNQLREAIDVWNELIDSSNENISNNAKKMTAKFDEAIASSIKKKVGNVASELSVELGNLNASSDICLSELEVCLLKDVIALRDSGNNEASLRITDCALSAGAKRDERLLDNRARALSNLNRLPEAIAAWRDLQGSGNKDVRNKSKQFADNATEKYLQYIRKGLVGVCIDYGLNIQILSSECESLRDFEELILQEAISARQSGRAEFSFRLIEKSSELGLTSLRLKDNQARALINLKRVPEAVSIWRELLNSAENSGFKQQIQKMLDQYGLISDRTCIVEQCSQYLASGDISAAKNIAINAIIDDPDWEESVDLLTDILKAESVEVDGRSSPHSDLKSHQLELESYELIISCLEKRMGESVIA